MSESGDNPNFFKSLEKRHQINNTITSLKNETGEAKNDITNLLSITNQFYKKLFNTKNVEDNNIDDYLNNINVINKLSKNESSDLENELTVNECYKTL